MPLLQKSLSETEKEGTITQILKFLLEFLTVYNSHLQEMYPLPDETLLLLHDWEIILESRSSPLCFMTSLSTWIQISQTGKIIETTELFFSSCIDRSSQFLFVASRIYMPSFEVCKHTATEGTHLALRSFCSAVFLLT
jgi:hypothetical protein